jgi:hypothetical protein
MGFAMLSALFVVGQKNGAFAQAGSVGGTIGKTDKSISGGEAPADSQRAVHARKPPRQAAEEEWEKNKMKALAQRAGEFLAYGPLTAGTIPFTVEGMLFLRPTVQRSMLVGLSAHGPAAGVIL